MHLAEAPVKIQLNGTSSGGSGPDLTGYPHLTYAPAQWGEGVRIASNGSSVDEIAMLCQEQLCELVFAAIRYSITLEELFDALRYARANGAV